MINELFNLSSALDSVKAETQSWHRKYKPIPNIRPDAPCVRITVSDGNVVDISLISPDLGQNLRKYGSNQGSYPCMNLASLYRVTDESVKKELADFCKSPETIDSDCILKIKTWCTEDKNNWTKKFLGKYKVSMEKTPIELSQAADKYPALKTLIDETNYFTSASDLHKKLKQAAWEMLERKERVSLALKILFYQGKGDKNAEDDYGSLSVAFDSAKLIDEGIPAVSEKFVHELNECLLEIDDDKHANSGTDSIDAFGIPFQAIEEPMPTVKLAGGFDVTLRTMFKEQRCQTRYGRIENASYPLSPQMRMRLQSALEWAGGLNQKSTTWINTDKNEILFAYPSYMPETNSQFAAVFGKIGNDDITFSEKIKKFINDLKKPRKPGTDTHANRITVFILRKIDKARTKVVYTCQTDPYELEKCSEEWTLGCTNLPNFPFGTPSVPYPLDVANTLNCFLKQDGSTLTDKFKPFPKYRGIEILMDPALSTAVDLHRLTECAMNIGAFLGDWRAKNDNKNDNDIIYHPTFEKAKERLSLMGLFLYRNCIRKDRYMDNLPYLYGQLLKAADELHALYCRVVRGGDYPPQLVGSSLFQSAAEMPVRTMNIMSQRIMPYYSWAKSYRFKNIQESQKESWRAGWLYSMCEKIMSKLQSSWTPQTRFNDEEKAQLFIGYLAKFPEKEVIETAIEEESENE